MSSTLSSGANSLSIDNNGFLLMLVLSLRVDIVRSVCLYSSLLSIRFTAFLTLALGSCCGCVCLHALLFYHRIIITLASFCVFIPPQFPIRFIIELKRRLFFSLSLLPPVSLHPSCCQLSSLTFLLFSHYALGLC